MSQINPFVTEDYLEVARTRYTEQFKNQLVFDKYVQLWLTSSTELQQALKSLMQDRSLDTAYGVQLDIIGDIVGQPRVLFDTALLKYFAYFDYPEAQAYGDLSDNSLGGPRWDINTALAGNTLLNDEQYRLFIKAKILKNSTNATPDDMIKFVNFVFGASISVVIAEGNAEFTLLVGKELNSFEKALLTYVSNVDGFDVPFMPKPVGVKVNYGQFPSSNFFGYAGVPGSLGFGSLIVLTSDINFDGTYDYDGAVLYNSIPLSYTTMGGGKYATLF
jgi:hypothetical protein